MKTIRQNEDGYALLERAILNIYMGVPLPEIVGLFRSEGYSQWDIYLTIRGAELILNKK